MLARNSAASTTTPILPERFVAILQRQVVFAFV
jgi:hypothetical protein